MRRVSFNTLTRGQIDISLESGKDLSPESNQEWQEDKPGTKPWTNVDPLDKETTSAAKMVGKPQPIHCCGLKLYTVPMVQISLPGAVSSYSSSCLKLRFNNCITLVLGQHLKRVSMIDHQVPNILLVIVTREHYHSSAWLDDVYHIDISLSRWMASIREMKRLRWRSKRPWSKALAVVVNWSKKPQRFLLRQQAAPVRNMMLLTRNSCNLAGHEKQASSSSP